MADPDTIPPTLTYLRLLPIDVTNGDVTTGTDFRQLDLRAEDNSSGLLEGFRYAIVDLDRPLPGKSGPRTFLRFDRSRTGTDPYVVTIASSTPAGSYNITGVHLYDGAGNRRDYTPGEISGMGMDTTIVIRSQVSPDGTPPSLTGLTLPTLVDLTARNGGASFSAVTQDTGSGGYHVELRLDRSYNTNEFNNPTLGRSDVLTFDSSTFLGGTATFSQVFSRVTSGGIYSVTSARVYDRAGNNTIYTASELTAAGMQTSFAVVTNSTRRGDFDGNGRTDVLWRNVGGAFSSWQVSGGDRGDQLQVPSTMVEGVSTDWKIVETLDFNGDGRSDILWRNQAAGLWSVWTGADRAWSPNKWFDTSVASDWSVAATGDLNGDGFDDIVWRQESGAFSTWQSTGAGWKRNVWVDTSVSTDWQIVGLADFDGDGKDDLMWRNQENGAWSVWSSTGDSFTPNTVYDTSVSLAWHVDALADFNGDGRDDILWRQDATGTFSIWSANGEGGFTPNTYWDSSVSPEWQVQTAGDFNADGRADIMWRNTSEGTFSTWESDGSGFTRNVLFVGGVGNDWQVQGHSYRYG